MAKKASSIADQISALESDLAEKNELLAEYEKLFDKLLKYTFGMDKKSIAKLISDSRKNPSAPEKSAAAAQRVDAPFSSLESWKAEASEGHSPSAI